MTLISYTNKLRAGKAQTLILEMVAAGVTKTAIAKTVGVTDMTILSVSQGKTKVFRKMKKLQRVYDRWKAGMLDLSGKRGKNAAPVAEEVPTGKNAPTKRTKVAKKPVEAVKAKRTGRPKKLAVFPVLTGFELPAVTEEMVAEVEQQIRRLQAEAKFMRDLMKIRKRYGQ